MAQPFGYEIAHTANRALSKPALPHNYPDSCDIKLRRTVVPVGAKQLWAQSDDGIEFQFLGDEQCSAKEGSCCPVPLDHGAEEAARRSSDRPVSFVASPNGAGM